MLPRWFQPLLVFVSLIVMAPVIRAQDLPVDENIQFETLKDSAESLYDAHRSYKAIIKADEMIRIAGDDSLKRAISNYIKGAAYNQVADQENAYRFLLNALMFFENGRYPIYLAKTYAELARLRMYRGDIEGSLDYYSRAAEIYENEGDAASLYKVKGNMGIVHGQQGDFTSAISTFHDVEQKALAKGDTASAIPAYLNLGQAFLRSGRPDSAQSYLEKAIRLSDRLGFEIHKADGMNSLSYFYFSKGDYKRSNELGEKSLQIYRDHKEMKRSADVLQRFSSSFAALGDYRKSNNYLWEYVSLKDSLYRAEKEQAIAEVEGRLLLNEKENSIQLLKSRSEADRRQKLMYLSLFGLALAIVVAVIIRLQNVRKLRRSEQRVHHKQMELELAQKDKLQNELDLKVRSLTREGLRIIQKNNQLSELREKLDELASKVPERSGRDLQSIRSSIEYAFNVDKDWDEFSVYFEEVHPSFLNKLSKMKPDLTSRDLRLCALLKVNMSTKEMASVLGISPESVKKARNRLRKKLNLDKDQTLNAFLQGI